MIGGAVNIFKLEGGLVWALTGPGIPGQKQIIQAIKSILRTWCQKHLQVFIMIFSPYGR
jgi:hypothetical protein